MCAEVTAKTTTDKFSKTKKAQRPSSLTHMCHIYPHFVLAIDPLLKHCFDSFP